MSRRAQDCRWFAVCETPSVPNLREHWAKRAARAKCQRDAVLVGWLNEGRPAIPLPAVVTLHRIGKRELDTDNLSGAMKAVRDEVARIAGVDDGGPEIEWQYSQETSYGDPRVLVICEAKNDR